jgi:proline dehydrogenase
MSAPSTGSSAPLSFNNTEIAFQSKSNFDLKKSYLIFKTFNYQMLVKTGTRLINFAFSLHLPIDGLVKKTVFAQFCGGENILECEETVKHLAKYHIGTILDYSVEGKEEEADFDATMHEIIHTIEKARNNPAIPFCVFKTTGIARFDLLAQVSAGEKLEDMDKAEYARVRHKFENICRAAADANVKIFVDAEESWIQDAIDQLATDMMRKYNHKTAIVYNTVQLYRHDRLEFMKASHRDSVSGSYYLGLKIVRGAYMEKERERAERLYYPSPIHANKENVDRDYDAAIRYCVEHASNIYVCAGTHNENSSKLLAELLLEKDIAKNDKRFYFSQLLGMSDHISFNLSQHGYNVAKYVPYGPVKAVMPYLFRRAQENTSVKGQAGRELQLIAAEMQRRKMK